jgi:hypothetical protein
MLASRDPSDISNIWPDWHEHRVNDGRRLDFIDAKSRPAGIGLLRQGGERHFGYLGEFKGRRTAFERGFQDDADISEMANF